MPRHANPDLERRILDAARKLWKSGGDKALTMRAVAQAAGTTTPTVYQRFASRERLLLALLRYVQDDFVRLVKTCNSPEELCECYLEFALKRPREYALFFGHQEELNQEARRQHHAPSAARPGVEAAKRRLAEWMGGTPDDYSQLHLALWSLMHGAAMLLISQSARDGMANELRESSRHAVQALLKELAPHRTTR